MAAERTPTIINGEPFELEDFPETGALVVRPETLRALADGETTEAEGAGTLHIEYALGSRHQYEIDLDGGARVTAEVLRESRIAAAPGARVRVGFDLARCHLIRDEAHGAR